MGKREDEFQTKEEDSMHNTGVSKPKYANPGSSCPSSCSAYESDYCTVESKPAITNRETHLEEAANRATLWLIGNCFRVGYSQSLVRTLGASITEPFSAK